MMVENGEIGENGSRDKKWTTVNFRIAASSTAFGFAFGCTHFYSGESLTLDT